MAIIRSSSISQACTAQSLMRRRLECLAVESLVGLADSDCPVPLVGFRSQKVQTAKGQPTRLALDGFPPIEQVSLSLNRRIHTVSVPLSGSTAVRLFPQ